MFLVCVCTFPLRLDIDDALDVFACHGVGGTVGCVLTGIMCDKTITCMRHVFCLIVSLSLLFILSCVNDLFLFPFVAATSGIDGGWINHNWKQLGIQLLAVCSCCLFAWWMCCVAFLCLLVVFILSLSFSLFHLSLCQLLLAGCNTCLVSRWHDHHSVVHGSHNWIAHRCSEGQSGS